MSVTATEDTAPTARRRPGRPRREIDLDAVADAAAKLFNQVGYDGISIEAVAEMLGVSRATLYRTVPTKDELLGILFERSTQDLHESATAALAAEADPREALSALIRLQTDAAVRMRRYMAVFFGGEGLSKDVYARWQKWTHEYEEIWSGAVARAMDAGVLDRGDALVQTRLILGMLNWVSRWYRSSSGLSADEIADAAIHLVLGHERS